MQKRGDVKRKREPALLHTVSTLALSVTAYAAPAHPKGELFVIWRQAEQNLPLRGRWHRAAMTERVLSVPPALFLSGLALSVTFGDTSPKGRGLGKKMKFAWTAKGSHFEERLPPRRGKMARKRQKGESGKADRL